MTLRSRDFESRASTNSATPASPSGSDGLRVRISPMAGFYNNAIFWVEVEKIKPNPFQPRKEFDEAKLKDFANSIRQYGVIQPLTVSRQEIKKRTAASRPSMSSSLASAVCARPSSRAWCRCRSSCARAFDDDKTKLELAIIENLQREDLNPIDRAKAFERLVKEFHFKHIEVAAKVGKSREYVSNTLRSF
jgi:ParB family chromosome partitioning protein